MADRKVIESVKREILGEVKQMREENKKAEVTGERMDIPAGQRTINVVLYRAEKEDAPLVMGYHGGGFLFGGNALNDAMWRAVSGALGANVVSVEYRKTPDFGYREAVSDAYDAAVYFYKHGKEYGIDGKHISTMGCSAGANLATAVCIHAQGNEEIKFQKQILLYPYLDLYTDPDSKDEHIPGGPVMYIFSELYREEADAKNPLVSPVFASGEICGRLPETMLCMAGNDSLRHEGYRYAAKLAESGVKTHVWGYPGMPHGFFEYGFGELNALDRQFMTKEIHAQIESGEIQKCAADALEFLKRCCVLGNG